MTSALPTGRVELVTLPRTCRKAGSGTSDCAGTARMTMAVVAIAIARSRRIGSLLQFPASESKESFAASQMGEREESVRTSSQPSSAFNAMNAKQIGFGALVDRRSHQ